MVGDPTRGHATVFVEEDTCENDEQDHPWAESVSYLAMAEHGVVQGTTLTPPSCERLWDAATAELSGARVDHLHAGHYGQGFVDFVNAAEDTITWTVTPCAPGVYSLVFGYGLAGGDRPLQVSVNGREVDPALSFPATGAWTAWGETAVDEVRLKGGANTVTLAATGSPQRATPRPCHNACRAARRATAYAAQSTGAQTKGALVDVVGGGGSTTGLGSAAAPSPAIPKG
jgi:hypothetical protein